MIYAYNKILNSNRSKPSHTIWVDLRYVILNKRSPKQENILHYFIGIKLKNGKIFYSVRCQGSGCPSEMVRGHGEGVTSG